MDPIKSTLPATEGYHANPINWEKAARVVKNLRGRIFKATKQGDDTATRHLQRLLLSTRSNMLIAARVEIAPLCRPPLRGKQGLEKGQKLSSYTPCSSNTSLSLAKGGQPSFLASRGCRLLERRVLALVKAVEEADSASWGSQDHVSSLTTRCVQSMVRNALEPEWEAKGEKGVYGPRPGRSCHDALETLSSLACSSQRQWVVTGNLSTFRLQSKEIVSKIASFPRADLVERWLGWKSMVENPFQGLPIRGRVIGWRGKGWGDNERLAHPLSPLLATIFLHGLEGAVSKNGICKGHGEGHDEGRGEGCNPYIRDRESFVVLCSSKRESLRVARVARIWLRERLVSLPPDQIRVERLQDGVDFLHVNMRSVLTSYGPTEKRFTTLLTPSKNAVRRLRERLLRIWVRSKGKNGLYPIRELNPHVLRWSCYFRWYDSLSSFRSLDNWMFQRAVRYAKRTHPNKGWSWIRERYFVPDKAINSSRAWIFSQGGESLQKFQWMGHSTHCPIPPTYSIDDSSVKSHLSPLKIA